MAGVFGPMVGGAKGHFDVCEANAICMGIAPEVFQLDDDEVLHLLVDTPVAELRAKIGESVRSCPKPSPPIPNPRPTTSWRRSDALSPHLGSV